MGNGKIGEIGREEKDGEVIYAVEITKDGRSRDYNLDEKGTLVSVEVTLLETPLAVQKTIQIQVGQGTLGSIDKSFDEDGVFYDFSVTHDGKDREFSVAENGKLESRQVFLSELSPAVQKTIQQHIGDGKLLRIDQVFEKKGAFSFEIEGVKDGKPFDFSVGPKGAFLGMDE